MPACDFKAVIYPAVLVLSLAPATFAGNNADLIHRPRVVGQQSCMDCHELPVQAWQQSAHAQRSLELISTNLRGKRYAERLGLDPNHLTDEPTCASCHGTQQRDDHGSLHSIGGVSCESCHGAAGGSEVSAGWLELHSGDEELPEKYQGNLSVALQDAGMAGTNNLYHLAVRCYSCHSVSSEQVVAVGHVAGTHEFEFSSWFSGEVRHNFAPFTVDVDDDELNAAASNLWLAQHPKASAENRKRLMFVIGQLADLEVNLRNRAAATAPGVFASAAASRSAAALARLERIAATLDDQQLSDALSLISKHQKLLFLTPDESHKQQLLEAAEKVAGVAGWVLEEYENTDLSAIDSLMPSEDRGIAYQP